VVAVSRVEISAPAGEPPQATVDLTYGSMKLEFFAKNAGGQRARQPEVG
jgi:hypothetical protein